MSPLYALALTLLLTILALVAYVDRIYSEMGRFLAREYQDNIDAWEQVVEPRLRLSRESVALSASIMRQLTLATIALMSGLRLYTHTTLLPKLVHTPENWDIVRTAFELVLLILIFDRLVPQILFTRTRGLWIARIRPVLQGLFYLMLPITLLLGLLFSIAALAEPEDAMEEEHPSEAMDALLEAGEEEGILEESDRELVRSVIEFGDKVVREVMTPRPEIIAVPGSLTLQHFTEVIQRTAFSRVPVYTESLDQITGIAFAHDLLHIADTVARHQSVASIQRPAAFVPETKNVAELLREMQREKQHMRIVIDEYGGVAGIVTIEDLLEAIVGNIADEHDDTEPDDKPVREASGAYTVSGAFELSRLRDLFADQFEGANKPHLTRPAEDLEGSDSEDPGLGEQAGDEDEEAHAESQAEALRKLEVREPRDTRDDPTALRLPEHYESTTIGGLVSEIAGHIPLPGEVVEEDGLRLEVLASTDRRIDRVRVSLATPSSDE